MGSDETGKILFSRIWLASCFVLLFVLAVGGWFITGYLGDKARQEILEYNDSRISLHSSHLTSELDKIERAVRTMSGSPWIMSALVSRKEQDIEKANSVLDRYNAGLESSVCYLMDSNGNTVASSNRNDSDSFVGKSYLFRPYFAQAIKGSPGRYFALGATSLKRGFYASYPVMDGKGVIIGVAVIKQDVDAHEAHLIEYPYCFVVDPNGIIFLSGNKLMNFKSLWPISSETKTALLKSKQFGEREFDHVLQQEVANGDKIKLYGKNYLVSRKAINSEGWSIILMTSTERIIINKAIGVIFTILICVLMAVPLVISYMTSRSAEMVRESELRYRDLVENATDLICTHDLKGTLLSVNAAAAKEIGIVVEEIVGLRIPDMLPQERRHEFNDYIKTIQSDGTATGTMKVVARNGEVRFWEYHNTLRTEGVPEPVVRGMARDVTGEVLAKRALRKSEKKYRQLFERNLAGVYRTTIDGRLIDCNNAFARIYGYESREEIMQRKAVDLHVSPEARQEYIAKLKEKGMLLDFEIKGHRKDGSLIWLLENVALIHDDKDGHTQLEGTIVDITDRKQAEMALQESEKKYRNILENIDDGYFEVDTAGNFTFFNDSTCRIIGYSADELMGTNNRKYVDEINAKKIFKVFNEVYKTGVPTKAFDWELIRKDGLKCFVEMVVSLITDSNKVKTGFRGIARDITERKRAEMALQESEKKYRNILENIEDGYFEVDTAGNFTFFNDSMCRILGYSADELMGKNNREYMDDKNAKIIFKVFNEVYKTGIPTKAFDWKLIRKDGSKCFVETVVSLIMDSATVKTGFRGIARDITERKRSEQELDKSLKRLRAALGGTIQALAVTVETRDPYTAGHQRRVSDLARAIATEMGLESNRIDCIRMAGIIHDIGKLMVPSETLSKPSMLSDIEYRLIQVHPKAGFNILKDIEFPWPIADVVLQHHERINGSGYPAGLKSEEILMEARIVAVADVVEAIASNRPYRPAQGIDKALEEIKKNRGILYDSIAADACLRLFFEKGYKLV